MSRSSCRITSPEDPLLDELCKLLKELSPALDLNDQWPRSQLDQCARYGVFEWFVENELGGQGWSDADIFRAYLKMSGACLTTTFVITQRSGACRRIAASDNEALKSRLLPGLIGGARFATVGISHLTTSRRHLAVPVLRARATSRGFVLDGFSPWVTGALYADVIVTGATMDDGQQVLVALPTKLEGVTIPPAERLVGLSASQTGRVECDQVELSHDWLIAGPCENVMKQGSGANTGGLQTSTLAIGLASAAVDYVETESLRRTDLRNPAVALRSEWNELEHDLLRVAGGDDVCSNEELRRRSNSLVVRAAQAALAAAKGSGYVIGHPAGRWCREALFFLVWSCPQPVMNANLCELAGIPSEDHHD